MTFTTLDDLLRVWNLINQLDHTIVRYESFRPLRGGNFSTLCGHLFVFLDFLCSRTNKPREGILSWYDFRPYLFSIFSSTLSYLGPSRGHTHSPSGRSEPYILHLIIFATQGTSAVSVLRPPTLAPDLHRSDWTHNWLTFILYRFHPSSLPHASLLFASLWLRRSRLCSINLASTNPELLIGS